ncbi:MAG: lipid-A-disaccharide synthase [Elusimicrobia bacterium]|nr:lipid-A-disaccharide synthase [Elusimicrobiota bacterium]
MTAAPPPIVLLVAGDPSGDLHASRLAAALKRRRPGLRVAAVGGPLLRGQAQEFLGDLASLGITGFTQPIRQLPLLIGLYRRLGAFMAERRPAALVCVDYYGFNRRVLGLAKRLGVPAFYYISPQVWATRSGRVRALKRLVDRMLLIFPFEPKLYHEARVPYTFVGHPLLDILPPARVSAREGGPLRVGLLPGSRRSELARHLPVLLGALARIRKDYPRTEALVFAAPSLPDHAYAPALARGAELVRESDYRARATLDLALTSSGTATLENALLGVPMVVLYKLSWPTYAIARTLIRVPYISMANLLAGRRLVPELVQREATAERVAEEALKLLEDPRRLTRLRRDLAGLRELLGGPGATERAAEAVLASIAAHQTPAAEEARR